MTQPLIRPPHAVYIWEQDNVLVLELPQANGVQALSHTLRLPLNVWGFTQAVNVIKARSELSRIGTKGDPTQAQTDQEIKDLMLGIDPSKVKKPKPKATPEQRSLVRDIMRRIGI